MGIESTKHHSKLTREDVAVSSAKPMSARAKQVADEYGAPGKTLINAIMDAWSTLAETALGGNGVVVRFEDFLDKAQMGSELHRIGPALGLAGNISRGVTIMEKTLKAIRKPEDLDLALDLDAIRHV